MATVTRISEDVADLIRHGVTAVGVTAVPISIAPMNAMKGVQIKAASGNSHTVYIGRSSVTTANGFELTAGEGVFIPIADISTVYAIGGAAAQEVRWIVL